MDPRLLDRFARLSSPGGKLVVEVGPGPGGPIAKRVVTCSRVELDRKFKW